MKINKNSFHYKLYVWTHSEHDVPDHTDLCSYVQRIIWCSLWKALYTTVGYLVYFLLLTPVVWCFGGRPALWDEYPQNWRPDLFKQYNGWRVWGIEMYPGYIIFPVNILLGEYYWWHRDWFSATVVHVILIATILSLFVFVILPGTDTWKLFAAWFKAKKQGVCPLVDFQDDSNPPDDGSGSEDSEVMEVADADILESFDIPTT